MCGVLLFCFVCGSLLIIKLSFLSINKERILTMFYDNCLCVAFFFYFGQIKNIVNKSKGEQYIFKYIGLSNAGRKNGKEKEKSNKYMQHQTCKVCNTKTTSTLESFHLPTRVTL